MQTGILLLCPMRGNGGIASWTKRYLTDFSDLEYHLYPVDIAPDKDFTLFQGNDRWIYGIKAFVRAFRNVRKIVRENGDIKLMHITTSGGMGTVRDYLLGKYCKRYGIQIIMHCRFGTVAELFKSQSWMGRLFRKSINLYDQIWVLDRISESVLKSVSDFTDKIFLTPNPIDVPNACDLHPKNYKRIGYIGNLLPSKGIFELMEAVALFDDDTELFMVGKGLDVTTEKINNFVRDNNAVCITILGQLSNQDAVKFMETLDIIALPTYYGGEAFPISILEAMSRGKLVISCPRAAIPDMLTSLDGTPCGILVKEKSPQAIADAIRWCQNHSVEADLMCRKAYEKVKSEYRLDVVYNLYKRLYKKALM